MPLDRNLDNLDSKMVWAGTFSTMAMAMRTGRDRGWAVRCGSSVAFTILALVGGCTPQPSASQSTARADRPDRPALEGTSSPAPDRLRVIASGGVVCDLVQQLADQDQTVAVTCLVQPGQDPHTYEPMPRDRAAIESASLILYGGYGFEGGLTKTLTSAPSRGPKMAIFETAVPQPLLMDPQAHDHDHDHDHGEPPAQPNGVPTPDPHVWHNPQHGIQLTMIVAEQLSRLVPSQADRYQQQSQRIIAELKQLDRWIRTQVATVPSDRRKLITTHDALRYYAQAYGFEVKGALSGLSTDKRPTPSDLAALVKLVKSAGVPTIFAEASTNAKTISTVAREAGVQVAATPLFIDGPGAAGSPGATYQTMLVSNTCTIVNGLGGRCQPQTAPIGPSAQP